MELTKPDAAASEDELLGALEKCATQAFSSVSDVAPPAHFRLLTLLRTKFSVSSLTATGFTTEARFLLNDIGSTATRGPRTR